MKKLYFILLVLCLLFIIGCGMLINDPQIFIQKNSLKKTTFNITENNCKNLARDLQSEFSDYSSSNRYDLKIDDYSENNCCLLYLINFNDSWGTSILLLYKIYSNGLIEMYTVSQPWTKLGIERFNRFKTKYEKKMNELNTHKDKSEKLKQGKILMGDYGLSDIVAQLKKEKADCIDISLTLKRFTYNHIKDIENQKIVRDDLFSDGRIVLEYEDKINNFYYQYGFENDYRVSQITVFINEGTLEKYEFLKERCYEDFGKPLYDKQIWSNRTYVNDESKWNLALKKGHLKYRCLWKIEESKTTVFLGFSRTKESDNLKIQLQVIHFGNFSDNNTLNKFNDIEE